jgi:5-hydroxyisourate hydrolase
MSSVTTHVLDTSRGVPAEGVAVALERYGADGWDVVARASTDADGRVRDLGPVPVGRYRLRFDTGAYLGGGAFYPEVSVQFAVQEGEDHLHLHLPLLLNPFGYSTYRGS